MFFYITYKHESKLQQNPMFSWKKLKQQSKYMVYQNIICGLLLQVPTTPLTFPILCV
jgi:hypothetical protein